MTNQTITGIDIGTSKITVITAKLSETENQPRIMGFASSLSRGVKKGQIVDINQVTTALEEVIEKAERMAGTKISEAFISVGGPHINSVNSHGVVAISQPEVEITTADVQRAIEAAKAISLSSTREVIEVIPREYVVDGQNGIKNPLGMSGVRLEVNTHMITAGVTNLRNVERSLTDLGIHQSGYVFSGLASALSTVSETEKELGVVLVDIGGGKTDICIFVDGALSYSCSIPMGSRHITNDIAVGLRVSLDSAEKIKLYLFEKLKSRGFQDDKNIKHREEIDITDLNIVEGMTSISLKTVVDGIMKPRLEEIFELIREEIVKSGFMKEVPSGLVLTGGGSLTVGSLETAKRVIGLSARIGIPAGITGLVDEVLFPQYATVVGLLLYAQEMTQTRENISNKDFTQIFRSFSIKSSSHI